MAGCVQYDTIRYDRIEINMRSKADGIGRLNLAHGPENEKIRGNKIKNRVAQKKRSRQRSAEAVWEDCMCDMGEN